MKAERNFDIHVFKLSNGEHSHDFEIEDSFFELFDNEIVNRGKLAVSVSLEKSDRMIQMNFHIDGSIKLICDRSLEVFDEQIDVERQMIYKYGEEEQELSDDVMVINKDTQTLNIAAILFEYILLEVPMKKLHPKFRDEQDDDESELLAVYISEEDDEDLDQTEEETIDPRWEKLKNLKK